MAESIREYLSKLGKRGAETTNSQLTPEQRKRKAKKAAQVRWSRVREEYDRTHPRAKPVKKDKA